jgi:DNA-binding XRE family transcriptional regulator
MPAAEKARRTKKVRTLISVSTDTAEAILAYAKRKDPEASILSDAPAEVREYINVKDTKWYKETKGAWHPGITLRIRRENAGMTQAQLARATGLAVSNISAMENGKRSIGLAVARKLAAALGRPISEFVEPRELSE